jgi:ABC-type uncharacterized transport system substrate-binding protein
VSPDRIEAFKQAMRQLGYVEGQGAIIELRFSEGRSERLGGLASELVGLKVDVIVTTNNDATRAARDASGTIPIVMALSGDPVAAGLVASYARPGGNITGFTTVVDGLNAKRLQLIYEAVPKIHRVAVLWRLPAHRLLIEEIEEAAQSLRPPWPKRETML